MIHYVIYDSPSDFPGRFVVRQWDVGSLGLKPMDEWDFESLDDARAHIPDGFVCINRSYQDQRVSTWYRSDIVDSFDSVEVTGLTKLNGTS